MCASRLIPKHNNYHTDLGLKTRLYIDKIIYQHNYKTIMQKMSSRINASVGSMVCSIINNQIHPIVQI